MALKLALILAIMDWTDEGMPNTPRITTVHWARGQMLAEEYRASVHRLLDELSIRGFDVKNEEGTGLYSAAWGADRRQRRTFCAVLA
ncbi:MAG: hypothetical protein IPK17_38775 [Chloroflexi bacterium]|uniref:hypothetical protein n=1 Tax=Candidatus Flexifilum breve TaxID=3140694 RepID=UPI003135847E|nr:hypothetical protein [Chloroflexota bacterium]